MGKARTCLTVSAGVNSSGRPRPASGAPGTSVGTADEAQRLGSSAPERLVGSLDGVYGDASEPSVWSNPLTLGDVNPLAYETLAIRLPCCVRWRSSLMPL